MNIKPMWLVIGGFVAAGILAGAVGYFTVVAPQSSKLTDVKTELAAAQTELVASEGASAHPIGFHPSDLFKLAKAMPNEDDMPGILLDLTRVSKQSKVTLVSVRPSPRIQLTLGYSALPLTVAVNGNYRQITKFLAILRHDVQVSSADKLKVGGRLFLANQVDLTGSAATNILAGTLHLDAFVYAAPPSLSATAGPPATGTSATGASSTQAAGAGAGGTA